MEPLEHAVDLEANIEQELLRMQDLLGPDILSWLLSPLEANDHEPRLPQEHEPHLQEHTGNELHPQQCEPHPQEREHTTSTNAAHEPFSVHWTCS